MSIWDDRPGLVEEVIFRHTEGQSAGEIATALELTRNQVGSKLDRLGLCRSPKKPKAPREVKRRSSGAYGNMASRSAIIDRARRCLRSGPQAVADLALMLDVDSHTAAGVMKRLKDLRELESLPKKRGRGTVYRLIRGPAPTMRGAAIRAAEDAYVESRKGGARAEELAALMNLTQTSAENFEAAFRSQTTSANSSDNSCPKFANHDKHLRFVWRARGFPALSEHRGSKDHVAVCLPVIWPLHLAGGAEA